MFLPITCDRWVTVVIGNFISSQTRKLNTHFLTNLWLKHAEEWEGVFINVIHTTYIPTQDCARKYGHGPQHIHSIVESEANLQSWDEHLSFNKQH